jgi:hypothetical protein
MNERLAVAFQNPQLFSCLVTPPPYYFPSRTASGKEVREHLCVLFLSSEVPGAGTYSQPNAYN